MIIRRVNVASAAKVSGALYALLGLVFGVIVALVSLMGAGFAAAVQQDEALPGMVGTMIGALFGIGAVVFLPIFYGLMGVIFGALLAALYNVVAGLTGGLSVDIE